MKNVEAKQQPYRDLAFFADSMHGSLARKLRIFGIDTAYSSSISDERLLWECNCQRRILLTSDKENLVKIFGEWNITELLFDSEYTRCTTCNIKLEEKKKGELDDLKNLVPPKSFLVYSHFYQCSVCKKIYWEGSHKPSLVSLAKTVTQELYRIS